jgi:hypothetical protein
MSRRGLLGKEVTEIDAGKKCGRKALNPHELERWVFLSFLPRLISPENQGKERMKGKERKE